MVIARVVGSVVSTQKNGKLEGAKLLFAQPLDLDGHDRGTAVIAIDAVDAGVGDRVLLVLDGKAAMMALDRGLAGVDAAIVGVVDSVEIPAEPARR
jgi:microcompartment protein CcmK/EutM